MFYDYYGYMPFMIIARWLDGLYFLTMECSMCTFVIVIGLSI